MRKKLLMKPIKINLELIILLFVFIILMWPVTFLVVGVAKFIVALL